MELSNDWHKRTNVKLVDILSDILKELRPPKVPKPTHGYTIAEHEPGTPQKPEVVTAPGMYFPAEKGKVIPLKSRQAGGPVTPTRTLQQMLEKLASYTPFPISGAVERSKAARERVEGQRENRFETAIMTEPKPPLVSRQDGGEVKPSVLTGPSSPLSSFGPQPTAPLQDFGLRPDGTPKGTGFLGVLNGPSGKPSTEISIGVNIDGEETLIPTLVPTLAQDEIDYLLSGGKPTDTIIGKAVEHAKSRMVKGLSPFAQEGEQTSTVGPAEIGKTLPLIPKQGGGEVDPNLFKETLSVGGDTQQGIEAAANTASLTSTPINVSPLTPSLQSYAPEANLTPPGPLTPPAGMAEYEANARKVRGLPTETGTPAVNPTNTFTPPLFRENKRSPVFGSDQLAAYNKKYGIAQERDLYQRLKASSGFPGTTPLFSRAPGGAVSPDPLEGLSEEERKRRAELLKTAFPAEFLASSHVATTGAGGPLVSYATTKPAEENPIDMVPNASGTFEAKPTPQPVEKSQSGISGGLSGIKKESLPPGETRYTLPGTEGTATVGPERFFVQGKEVPKGTPGAVSGDEAARQRIFNEASRKSPEIEAMERWQTPGYKEAQLAEAQKEGGMISIKGGPPIPSVTGISPGYEKTRDEAHPEERFMDMVQAENKSSIDEIQKSLEENKRRADGFGLSQNPKTARIQQAEAIRNGPILTQQLAELTTRSEALAARVGTGITPPGMGKTPILNTNEDKYSMTLYGQSYRDLDETKRKAVDTKIKESQKAPSPTELGLIAKAGEKGPDGKPTVEAIVAQRTLDAEKARKLDIASGGIPPLGNIPTTFPGKYNEAALEGLDPGVVAVIKKLVNYEIPLPSGFALKVPYWQNALARASAYDPTWDVMQYPVKFGVRKSFTSGKDKDNIVALNTAVGHINSLVRAKDELANSNWVTGNTAVNLLAKYFPVSQGLVERQGKVTGVKTKFNAVKGEMANIFKRSGATDQEIKSWNDTLTDPSTATPTSWNAFIGGSLELMGSRIEALRNIYERGIGNPKDFAFLSDKSRTILKKLGVDVNAIDPVAGTKGEVSTTEKRPPIESRGGNPEGGGVTTGAKTADDLLRKYGVQ